MKTGSYAALAAMLILTNSFASCGQAAAQPGETMSETEASVRTEELTTEAASALPDRDFDGYVFTFLNGNTSYANNSVIAEEQTAETINDAIYKRNASVEERYNITLAETISNSPQADYTKAVAAGESAFDLALLRMEWAMPAVLQNQTVNWASIPNLNLDAEYWVQNSISAMSLMNNVYFAVSAFDITHFDSVRTFCFNKNMVTDFQLESPYELVDSGEWTLAKYREMCLAVAEDLNSNEKWDIDDRYGTVGYSNVYCNTLMAGIGSVLSISKDENDVPYFNLDSEPYLTKLLTVSKLLEDKENGLIYKENKSEIFRGGRSLFYVELICSVSQFRDMDDDFGIIPAPKYDEEQSEYINLGGSPFFMVVPVTAADLDRTGAVMEALAYDSLGVIDSAYYDVLLKGKISRDDESEEMLDLIFSTLVYYHPLANSYLNAPLAEKYLWSSRTDFASYFASVKDAINSEIDEAMRTYAENVAG